MKYADRPFKKDINRAHEIYWNAVTDLGPDLGGGSVVDLLADNMDGDLDYLRELARAGRILDRDTNRPLPLNVYTGERYGPMGNVKVTVNGKILPTCYGKDGVQHSPDGFEWGYGGSGPAQLAFAILCHHFGRPKPEAMCLYMDFKWKVISRFDQELSWALTTRDVAVAIAEILENRQKLNEQYRNLSF